MIVHHPTLKQLQYLVALRAHGHFGRAAESCFVTQSTLSAACASWRHCSHHPVERTRRVVRFTPLGTRVADKAVRVLARARSCRSGAAESQPLTGELRMGVIPTHRALPAARNAPCPTRQFPRLACSFARDTSQAACEALHRGQLDCVLLALPYACGEVDSAELFEDHLLVAFPFGEAPPTASIDAGNIDERRLLLLEDGHCLKDHALAACNRPEIRAGATMMGTSLHTLVQMVDNGLGLTFVPQMAVDAGLLEGTRIKALPLQGQHGARELPSPGGDPARARRVPPSRQEPESDRQPLGQIEAIGVHYLDHA